jgi:hypothetical protein
MGKAFWKGDLLDVLVWRIETKEDTTNQQLIFTKHPVRIEGD